MRELRVVLVGQEAAGDRALHRIIDAGHCVVAVFTDPTKEPSGKSKLAISAARRGVEQCEGALVRQPQLAGWLREQAIDLLFNVHSLHLVTAEVVDAPTIGSFNLHPGPLPGYPGLNAPSWAVYERRDTFGCTVHWLNDTIDAGCIAYETSFAVGERDNGLTLTARCVSEGLQLLARLLDDAATDPNRIPRREQAGNRVERGPGPPHDGWIGGRSRPRRSPRSAARLTTDHSRSSGVAHALCSREPSCTSCERRWWAECVILPRCPAGSSPSTTPVLSLRQEARRSSG